MFWTISTGPTGQLFEPSFFCLWLPVFFWFDELRFWLDFFERTWLLQTMVPTWASILGAFHRTGPFFSTNSGKYGIEMKAGFNFWIRNPPTTPDVPTSVPPTTDLQLVQILIQPDKRARLRLGFVFGCWHLVHHIISLKNTCKIIWKQLAFCMSKTSESWEVLNQILCWHLWGQTLVKPAWRDPVSLDFHDLNIFPNRRLRTFLLFLQFSWILASSKYIPPLNYELRIITYFTSHSSFVWTPGPPKHFWLITSRGWRNKHTKNDDPSSTINFRVFFDQKWTFQRQHQHLKYGSMRWTWSEYITRKKSMVLGLSTWRCLKSPSNQQNGGNIMCRWTCSQSKQNRNMNKWLIQSR